MRTLLEMLEGALVVLFLVGLVALVFTVAAICEDVIG